MIPPEIPIPLGIGIFYLTFLLVGSVLICSILYTLYIYLSGGSEKRLMGAGTVLIISLVVFVFGNLAFLLLVPQNIDDVSGSGNSFDWWMIWVWSPIHLAIGIITIWLLRKS